MSVIIKGGSSDRPLEQSGTYLIVEVIEEKLAMEFGQLTTDGYGDEDWPVDGYYAQLFTGKDPVLVAAVKHVFAGNSKIVFRADPRLDYGKDFRIFR